MRRHSVNKKQSARAFRNKTYSTKSINVRGGVHRGGIRL